MGFRFRKSIRVLPGVRLNLSKSGVSASLGRPGLSVNVSRKGVRKTVGLPGSGLSYSDYDSFAPAEGDAPAPGVGSRTGGGGGALGGLARIAAGVIGGLLRGR